MRLVYAFDREHPFGKNVPFDFLERYRDAVADDLRERFPDWEIAVQILDSGLADVEFEPEDELSPDDRLKHALDVKHAAHRIAEAMFADSLVAKKERGEA